MGYTKKEYNDVPVFYCNHCLSLNIKTLAEGSKLDYCDNCGSTDIAQAHIEEWENIYKERHGFKYLNNTL